MHFTVFFYYFCHFWSWIKNLALFQIAATHLPDNRWVIVLYYNIIFVRHTSTLKVTRKKRMILFLLAVNVNGLSNMYFFCKLAHTGHFYTSQHILERIIMYSLVPLKYKTAKGIFISSPISFSSILWHFLSFLSMPKCMGTIQQCRK